MTHSQLKNLTLKLLAIEIEDGIFIDEDWSKLLKVNGSMMLSDPEKIEGYQSSLLLKKIEIERYKISSSKKCEASCQ
jgi:hypothetical protein